MTHLNGANWEAYELERWRSANEGGGVSMCRWMDATARARVLVTGGVVSVGTVTQ